MNAIKILLLALVVVAASGAVFVATSYNSLKELSESDVLKYEKTYKLGAGDNDVILGKYKGRPIVATYNSKCGISDCAEHATDILYLAMPFIRLDEKACTALGGRNIFSGGDVGPGQYQGCQPVFNID